LKKFDVGFNEITIDERSTEVTISDKVMKGTIKVVLNIYTLAED
jgi:hypothetical protein